MQCRACACGTCEVCGVCSGEHVQWVCECRIYRMSAVGHVLCGVYAWGSPLCSESSCHGVPRGRLRATVAVE